MTDLGKITAPSRGDTDSILLSVLANRLDSICREMTNTLLRSARSAVINQARDISCAIITADGQLLASAEGLPIHVIGSELLAQAMTDLHDDLAPGDAFLHNDPYLGSTHSGDHAILVPVFFAGEHVFTAVAKAHQADTGNSLPTTYMPMAKDIYEEGALNFPCVRIQRDGKDEEGLIRMCQRRIRVPDQWYGDYLAAVGAARIAERRLIELCENLGWELVQQLIGEWFDYSERRMVAAIGELPAITLENSSLHDRYPGLPDGIPLQAKIAISPEEGRITIDVRDNPDNYAGGLNQTRATATASVMTGLFNSIDPDLPHNAGVFRRVDVLLREGCIAGIPRFPHSCSMATTNVTDRMISLVQAAFAELGDGYGMAEGPMGMPPAMAVISGEDDRFGGGPYVNQIFLGSGGGPASPESDGWPTYLIPDSAALVYKDSIEIDEQRYPIHVYEQRLLPDTEAAGRFRGGFACRVTYGPAQGPMTVAYAREGHENPPQGVRGGLDGQPTQVWKENAGGAREEVTPVGTLELAPGERVVSTFSGGGGYGSPLERDPELVALDVREGLVSVERALSVYGVVISETGSVDVTATTERRRGES